MAIRLMPNSVNRFLAPALMVLLLPVCASAAGPKSWNAGLARVAITPEESVWMAGFAARSRPSEGVCEELYAKALALQDSTGQRSVLLTTDLVGIPGSVAKIVAERAQ